MPVTQTIKISASETYSVLIGRDILKDAGRLTSEVISPRSAVLVSDDTVFYIYGEAVKKSFSGCGFDIFTFIFPHGEGSKDISMLSRLLEFCAESKLTRSDFIIALGGGVT